MSLACVCPCPGPRLRVRVGVRNVFRGGHERNQAGLVRRSGMVMLEDVCVMGTAVEPFREHVLG